MAVDLRQKIPVNCAAVAAYAPLVNVKRVHQEAFMACHDVGEVAERLRCVSLRSDVDMYAASPAGVALRSGVPQLPDELL